MRNYILAFCLLVSGCAVTVPKVIDVRIETTAPTYRGIDVLGLAKQDVRMIAQEIDPGTAIGVLKKTFGPEEPAEQVLINTHKVSCFRVQLIDGTVNNHACAGNVTSLSVLRQRAQEAKVFFIDHNPGQCAYLSPVLEHGCTNHAVVDGWFNLLHKEFPQFGVVCSSNGRGYCPPNVLKEVHGNTGSAPFRSNDGADVFASPPEYQNSGSVMTLAWSYCANGRLSSEKPGTPVPPPTQRVNWCTRDQFRHMVRIMRPVQPKPQGLLCKDIVSPNINKPRSENYGIGHGDSRQDKPMVILSRRYPRLSIQTLGNKEVGCFKYFGTYGTNQSRLYEGNCSGKSAPQLQDLLGGEWGKIISGKDCYNYNSIRRQGMYR